MVSRLRACTLVLVAGGISIALAGCGSSSKSSAAAPGATTSTTAAKSYVLKAMLKPGLEVPKAKEVAGATGTFIATITLRGSMGTLTWVLTFAHLSGPATAAHVHIGAPGQSGPVAVPLCGPCKSPNKGSFTGLIGANSKLLSELLAGGAYVNVHTKRNPGGEIRGQLTATAGSAAAPAPNAGPSSSSSSGY